MPKFYFHLRDGSHLLVDGEGLDLPDAASAEARAVSETKGLLSVELCEGPVVDLNRTIEVTDENGAIIHALRFDDIIRIMRHDQALIGQNNK